MKLDLAKLTDEELQELEDSCMAGVDPYKYTMGDLVQALEVGLAVSAELSRRQRTRLLRQTTKQQDYSHLVDDLF